jgi:acetyl esterase/lipase
LEQIYCYDISLQRSNALTTRKTTTRIYYFAGGGWQSPPSSHHYRFLLQLLGGLSASSVCSVVSYPLAPENKAPESFPVLLRFSRRVLADGKRNCEKIIFAGDSAGGNLALSLILESLRLDPQSAVPHSILLICPAVDLAHQNSELPTVEKKDPLLRVKFSKDVALAWAGDWDVATDSRLSPIRAENLAALKESGVGVYGITGSFDILTPDTIILRDKLLKHHVQGRWLHWHGCMHCWPLMAGYGMLCKEVRGSFEWILQVLKDIEAQPDNAFSEAELSNDD